MRILHTADWHLGHRLYDHDRTPEHEAALHWLYETIVAEKVDVVIIAGDVFDVSSPSNQARRLYYNFLSKLLRSDVCGVVVVGGNHDSPNMLDAPHEIFQSLDIHVVGAARARVQSQVVTLTKNGPEGAEEIVIAAVPFLRERDVRTARFGESSDERMAALKAGIRGHFETIAEAAREARSSEKVPIVATGHLFVGGASDAEDKQSHIYQADENNIDAGNFPDCFDYVALGHVHRAQSINGQDKIRYSGSLIPLTFVEGARPRSVRIVNIGEAGQAVRTRKVFAPAARRLHRMHGTLEEVKAKIRTAVVEHLALQGEDLLTPWAEVQVVARDRIVDLPEQLQACVDEVAGPEPTREPIRFVRRSQSRLHTALASAPKEKRQLDDLKPEDVFKRVCAGGNMSEELSAVVLNDFRELINWQQNRDND